MPPTHSLRCGLYSFAASRLRPDNIPAHCERLLERAMTQQCLSAHDRILKVARTISDLDGTPQIEPKHIAEAIQYRSLDRTYWT